MIDPKRIAEAALFMSPDPLPLVELAKTMGIESKAQARHILDDLIEEFNSKGIALEIVKVGDDRYRMQVRDEILPKVSHLAITVDLSKPVLRTLAIIAFKQPIRQSIVVKLRGNKAYDHIHLLEEQGFIKRTKEANTFLLETTKKFEQYFGPPITSEEIEIILSNLDKRVEERLRRLARRYGYEMEVIK